MVNNALVFLHVFFLCRVIYSDGGDTDYCDGVSGEDIEVRYKKICEF